MQSPQQEQLDLFFTLLMPTAAVRDIWQESPARSAQNHLGFPTICLPGAALSDSLGLHCSVHGTVLLSLEIFSL